MQRDRLVVAIREIYDSATDAALWPQCLTSIGRLLNGTTTSLLYHDHRSKGGIQIAIGADPELFRLYSEYGHAIDPWALAFPPRARSAGSVVIGASVVDHPSMMKTEFYAAMGRRYECTRNIVGILEASPLQTTAALSINRGDRHDEFDLRDARVVSILLPHLRRVLAVRRRLAVVDNERASVLDAIDRLALGIILVDDRARPIFVNRYAARVLQNGDGLSIEKGSVIAALPAVSAHLERALGSALAVANGAALETDCAEFLIPRASGRRPLHAAVSPFRHRPYDGLPAGASAVLFLVDPETNVRALNDHLRALYSLTAAEARVAGAVAAGQSAIDVSERFGVSRETARSQIKKVFEKANVRSQAAFIRLIATESLRLVHSRHE
jgi:DNA-binding CsgD family transcriptional regulator